MDLIGSELAVGEQGLVYLLVGLKLLVFAQELEDLFNDFGYFVLNLVKHPVIVAAVAQNAGIFKVDKMARGFGLREIQYFSTSVIHISPFV